MKNNNTLKTINWVAFIIILMLGIFTAGMTLYDLNTQVVFGE